MPVPSGSHWSRVRPMAASSACILALSVPARNAPDGSPGAWRPSGASSGTSWPISGSASVSGSGSSWRSRADGFPAWVSPSSSAGSSAISSRGAVPARSPSCAASASGSGSSRCAASPMPPSASPASAASGSGPGPACASCGSSRGVATADRAEAKSVALGSLQGAPSPVGSASGPDMSSSPPARSDGGSAARSPAWVSGSRRNASGPAGPSVFAAASADSRASPLSATLSGALPAVGDCGSGFDLGVSATRSDGVRTSRPCSTFSGGAARRGSVQLSSLTRRRIEDSTSSISVLETGSDISLYHSHLEYECSGSQGFTQPKRRTVTSCPAPSSRGQGRGRAC